MPSINFQYVPTQGNLSGKSFESQTEQAFNELGVEMSSIEGAANLAVTIANQAVATAENAANIATTANQTAGQAQQTAQTAQSTANTAINTANIANQTAGTAATDAATALSLAQNADTKADTAIDSSSQARRIADTALTSASEAKNIANSALVIAQGTAGIFEVDSSTTDLDDIYSEPIKLYLTNTGIAPSPLAAPAYLDATITSDRKKALQTISNDLGQEYIRFADITQKFTAGTETFNMLAVDENGSTAGTLEISHSETDFTLSTFTPGTINILRVDPYDLIVSVSFLIPSMNNGVIKINGVDVVSIIDGTATTIITDIIHGTLSNLGVKSVSLASGAIDMTIDIFWTAQENTIVEWKAWNSIVPALATTTTAGIARFATLEEALSGVLEGVMINPVDLKEVLKGGGTPKGKIEFLPFRTNELPFGYYFCNGDQYPLTSTQGAVLNSLPENYKLDWGITISGGNISLPNMFHTDGRGYFLRAANGTARQAGSIELDDFKSHVHQYYYWEAGLGGFSYGEAGGSSGMAYPNTYATGGTETRSINKGMTPAIYLGV